MVSVTIDNINVTVSKNSTIIEACDFAGIVVPRFCFHDKLKIAGNCRMCIVEIEKFPKPISSCTMNVNEGMKIFTKTPMVKRAQESVLEFLLINHPLDCPICDQGGECDLQDQLLFFGSDSSKFFKYKRGVEDKNCSLLVKTIMTRCIHCTRCVRFLTDVAGDNNLGVLGRSSQAEIGLYMSNNLESEFSGNIIDLCPVGALTSKPYSFRGRSWELINYPSIDILDGLGSNIMVSVKGSEVMRILPNINEAINMEWISDRTRFSYDSFDFLRIKKPWSKYSNNFISWLEAFKVIKGKLSNLTNTKVGSVLGEHTDLETAIAIKHFMSSLGSSSIYSEFSGFTNLDFRSNFLFNSSLKGVEESDVCLVIGSDTRLEGPLLDLRIREQVINGKLTLGYIGPSLDLTYPVQHLGISSNALVQLLQGQHPFCTKLKKAKNPLIILGNVNGYSMFLIDKIKSILGTNISAKVVKNFSCFNSKASSAVLNEVGFLSFDSNVKNFDILFVNNANNIKKIRQQNKKAFIVFIGPHYSVHDLNLCDLILPSPSSIEKESSYINVEGLIQRCSKIRGFVGDSRPEWFFFVALADFLQKFNFEFCGKSSFYKGFEPIYPFIFDNKKVLQNYDTIFLSNTAVLKKVLNRNVEDFYLNNSFTQASKVMSLCSKKKKKHNFLSN